MTASNEASSSSSNLEKLPLKTRERFTLPSLLAASSDNKFLDHAYALGRGIEQGRDTITDLVLHPIDNAKDLAVMSWDGLNAISSLLFGYSAMGSRARNQIRGAETLKVVDFLKEADSAQRLEFGSAIATSMILGQGITNVAGSSLTFARNAGIGLSLTRKEATTASSLKSRITSSQQQTTSASYNATGTHAQKSLNKKFRALENAQKDAVKIQELSDGRIRYYTEETFSTNPGPTRGAAYVTEHNPNTGQVRSWMECYDHSGKANRVHPKMLDGQDLKAQHFPATESELNSFSKKPGGP